MIWFLIGIKHFKFEFVLIHYELYIFYFPEHKTGQDYENIDMPGNKRH